MTGIYIHIPFCVRKCNYCDFASYPQCIGRSDEYVSAVCRELSSYPHEKADTVYFGGGTPSLLETAQLSKIADAVFSNFDVSGSAEITLEVNPKTADSEKIKSLKSIGFNRISLGSQSFCDNELKILGRIHSSEDTVRCYDMIRNAGFDNVSLDLMYAIPGQNMESLSTSINQVLKLAPEHISCYGLKFEPGTPFYAMLERGELSEKSEDEYADMYDIVRKELGDAGYFQYELSNFSKKGYESKHNLKYWLTQNYIGAGLSASSCYRDIRYTNTSDFENYIRFNEREDTCTLTQEDKMSEFMILSLRLTQIGAVKEEFTKRFGKSVYDVFGKTLDKHIRTGMLKDLGDRIVLSERAYYVSNGVLCDFV